MENECRSQKASDDRANFWKRTPKYETQNCERDPTDDTEYSIHLKMLLRGQQKDKGEQLRTG
jgi:hypothetical protein